MEGTLIEKNRTGYADIVELVFQQHKLDGGGTFSAYFPAQQAADLMIGKVYFYSMSLREKRGMFDSEDPYENTFAG